MKSPNKSAASPTPGEPIDDNLVTRFDSWVLVGKCRLLTEFFNDCLAFGWEVSLRRFDEIKGGERWWLTLTPAGTATDGCSSLSQLPPIPTKLIADLSGRTSVALVLMARAPDLKRLSRHLGRTWELTFLGSDGGWGGEPYYEVKKRSSRAPRSPAHIET